MKRMTWLVPAVLAAAGCNNNQNAAPSATYSPGSGSPMTYSGGPSKNGSSQMPAGRTVQTPAPVVQSPPPAYQPVARANPTPHYVPASPPPPPPPPPPTTYTPPVVATAPPPPPPPTQPAPPATTFAPVAQGFVWAHSLAEAQQTARATGRLIFLETGRDTCGNCQALKRKVVPEVGNDLGAMCVGYYDDCDRDAGSQAFRILTQNLPNAVMLPLVGWVTPDLRWVSGFSGGKDASRFRQEMAKAQTAYRQMGALPAPTTGREMGMAPASPASLPDAELADIGAELLGEAPAAVPAPIAVAAPAAPASGPALVAAPASAPTDALGSRAWAQGELRRAAAALSTRDYASARRILAEVRTQAAGEPEAREADKGEVAIYNLRRLERTPAEAGKVREQAQHDLRNTVWVALFA